MRSMLIAMFLLVACGDDDRGAVGGANDSGTRPPSDGNAPPSLDGSGIPDPTDNTCTVSRARWVYVVDRDDTLMRFEPDSLTFTPIGTLECDTESAPFSMSIDRDANAWVLYQTHELYSVSTLDASCSPTSYLPDQNGMELFGMGFVADDEENRTETLFVAGGLRESVPNGESRLAVLDTSSLAVTPRGTPWMGFSELTGTGTGQLWSFVPGMTPAVRRLNKDTAAAEVTIPINAVPAEEGRNWAFAFWGGRFYVFLHQGDDPSTNVYRVDPTDQSSEKVLDDTGFLIVGAGVSTCAPTTLI